MFRHPQPHFSDPTAPHHPSLRTDLQPDDERRLVGRNAVPGASGPNYPTPTTRSHSHSITQSSASDNGAEQSQLWSARSSGSSSRISNEYTTTPSAYEYSPHPFSSASLAARQGATGQYPSSHPVAEGPSHPSSSRGSERAPPSSFPHYNHGSSGNRPRSGHSSEGDETKSGYGKYECEYCSKRFNRPSSLRVSSAITPIWTCHSFQSAQIHINTHTGAKRLYFRLSPAECTADMNTSSVPMSFSKLWASFQCHVQYETPRSNTRDPPYFLGGR
jgi:hypothetical protein